MAIMRAGVLAVLSVLAMASWGQGNPVSAPQTETDQTQEERNAKRLIEELVRLQSAGRFTEAIPLAEKVLAIREKTLGPEHPDTFEIRDSLALLYKGIGALDRAEPLYQRQMAIVEKLLGANHPATAARVHNLGGLYYATGDYAQAELLYRRALTILEKVLGPEHPDTAKGMNSLATLHLVTGAYAKAELLWQRVLAANEKNLGAEHPDTAKVLNNLAELYRLLGAYAKSEPLHQRALAIYEKAPGPEHPDTATSLNNLAALYDDMGAYGKAEPLHQRALAIREKVLGPEHSDTATSLNNLAKLYSDMGAYGKAEPLYQRALAIIEKALGPEHRDTARSLNNLAGLYRDTGAYGKAEPLYQRALAIHEKALGPEHPATATSLNNLAALYDDMGAYGQAEPLYRRALAIREKALGPEHPDTATSLNNLARQYYATGAYGKAEPFYQRALAITEKALGPEHRDTARSLNNLAGLYRATGAYGKAEPLYQRALAIVGAGQSPEALWRIQDGLSRLSAQAKRPSEAIYFGKQAVNTIQALRGQLVTLDKELQKSFLTDKVGAYRHLSDLLIDAGRLPEAQQVLAMLKEEEYFDFVRRDASAKVEATRASLSTTEQPWQARYDQIAARLLALGEELRPLRQIKASFRSAEQNARIGALESDLRVAQQAYSSALDEMRSAFAKLDAQRSGVVASRQLDVSRIGLMDELSKQTGRPVVLLQYIVLDDALRILLTSGATQKAYRLPKGAKEINRAVAELQAQLRSPAQDPRAAARALYDMLIAPLAPDLYQAKAATLMVSLDASLRYVPLSVLHDGTRYLAERYAIAVVNEAAGSDNLKDVPQPSWEVAGLGLTRAHEGFAPLPAVKGELEGIVRRKDQPGGVLDGVIYLDQAFTEKTLQRSLSDRLPVLHLASHFQFRPGTEKDSFLLLGDGSKLDLGSLRSRYQFAGVDLITLSACDTAVGGGSGSEVDGLALTVQKNGAKGVLATLWPVADASTGRLMQEFYRLRQSAPHLTKAEALRQAQLALLKGEIKRAAADTARGARPLKAPTHTTAPAYATDPDKPYAHPFYWAPFILMGNWL